MGPCHYVINKPKNTFGHKNAPNRDNGDAIPILVQENSQERNKSMVNVESPKIPENFILIS